MARLMKSIGYLGLFGFGSYALLKIAVNSQEETEKEIVNRRFGYREASIESSKPLDGKTKIVNTRQIIAQENLEKNKNFMAVLKAAADDPHPIYRPKPKDS